MEKYNFKDKEIKLHNILFATTTKPDYEMSRFILLESLEDINYNEYVLVEGYHCSCYDFDDCKWEAMKYTEEELVKLAESKINDNFYYSNEKDLYKYILDNLK